MATEGATGGEKFMAETAGTERGRGKGHAELELWSLDGG